MWFALVVLIISGFTWTVNTSLSCPPVLNITLKWVELHPFMFIQSTNNQTDLAGFLPPYIKNASNKCGCAMLDFIYQQMNISSSEEVEIKIRSSLQSTAPELYFPVFANHKESTQYQRPFLALFHSPGPAVLERTQEFWEEKVSWISMIVKTWSTLYVCLLLGIMAGFIVWAIEQRRNPDDFPSRFPHGALAGIWWSFVTMTTVGYGDKTTRTLLGRMFAVFWMVLGTIVMSVFTGQITANLTSRAMATVDLMDKKIAVPKGMKIFIEQEMNLGARYFDLTYSEMVKAFQQYGIQYLMIHDYKMAQIWLKSEKGFRLVKAIDRQFFIGIAITGNVKPAESFFNCVQRETIDIYQIFLARSKLTASSNSQDHSDPTSQHIFLIAGGALLVLFVVMGILQEWKRRKKSSRPSDIEQDPSSAQRAFATELPPMPR